MLEIESHGEPPTRYSARLEGYEVGFLVIDYLDPLLQTVNTIYVDPAYRRKGVATQLWEAAKIDWPYLQHSKEMTVEGFIWASSLGQAINVSKIWSKDNGETHQRGTRRPT